MSPHDIHRYNQASGRNIPRDRRVSVYFKTLPAGRLSRFLASFPPTPNGLYEAARLNQVDEVEIHVEQHGRLAYRLFPSEHEALRSDDCEVRKAAVRAVAARLA